MAVAFAKTVSLVTPKRTWFQFRLRTAVEHAMKACELSQREGGNHLDTLAAAYAEIGNFEEAIRCQKRALKVDVGPHVDAHEDPRGLRRALALLVVTVAAAGSFVYLRGETAALWARRWLAGSNERWP